jgi:hypothetical protein
MRVMMVNGDPELARTVNATSIMYLLNVVLNFAHTLLAPVPSLSIISRYTDGRRTLSFLSYDRTETLAKVFN